tara:strand:- start:6136 stop:6546 length:411 start_codon:yes stop_codon:yes gene_type:complete
MPRIKGYVNISLEKLKNYIEFKYNTDKQPCDHEQIEFNYFFMINAQNLKENITLGVYYTVEISDLSISIDSHNISMNRKSTTLLKIEEQINLALMEGTITINRISFYIDLALVDLLYDHLIDTNIIPPLEAQYSSQ